MDPVNQGVHGCPSPGMARGEEVVVVAALDCHLCLEHLVSRVDKAQ